MSKSLKSRSLPTYDFLKKLDSQVSVEYSKLEVAYNSYDSTHAHRHDYFEMLYFEKSGGTHEIDFISYPVIKNSIHFISPGQVHLLRRNKNVTGHVIAFKEEAFLTTAFSGKELLMPSSAISPVAVLSREQSKHVAKSLSNLISEYSNNHNFSQYSLSAYLMLLVIEVLKVFEKEKSVKQNSSSNNLYHNFRRLVDKEISSIHSVADYAKKLNVSPGHLNDTVKRESGKSASEIIYERLILEAKRMLYHSALSIKEISNKLNYEDPAYFTRFFKKHVRLTPVEFRDRVRAI